MCETPVIFILLLRPGCLDNNHLYVFGKSLHQQQYKVLGKGIDAGLRKQHISNLFNSATIENFSGARNGKLRPDFTLLYDDYQGIPDPSTLDPTQKNLMLLHHISRVSSYTSAIHHS